MQAAIETYLEVIRADYRSWTNITPTTTETGAKVRERMTAEFCSGLTTTEGGKFIKVIAGNFEGGQRTVHSFIVKKDMKTRDGKEFKQGDILMAAGWAAPAMNFSRGNILTGDFKRVRWTGAV